MQEEEKTTRLWYLDNIKSVIIFLVVIGHIYETVQFPGRSFLYNSIYFFHMPAMVFVSGFLYKRQSTWTIVRRLLLPYVVFQTLYLLFGHFVLKENTSFQYTTPYWLLWYLMALMFWREFSNAILPLKGRRQWLVLGTAVAIALAAGFNNSIGYWLSLSRTLVLYPFFLGGALMGQAYSRQPDDFRVSLKRYYRIPLCLALLVCIGVELGVRKSIRPEWLYHSFSFTAAGYNAWIRLGILTISAVYTLFLVLFSPNRRFPVLTRIGQNTMPVFILHGAIIKYLSYIHWAEKLRFPMITSTATALAIVLILSSRPVVWLWNKIF